MDLDGEGLSGILTEQAEGWFYKPNLSPINVQHEDGKETITARFGPVELVAQKPSLATISGGRQQFLDLAGDGQLDLVELRGPTPGFYERTQDEGWETFAPFESLPVLDWDNPNLRFVDLTGDGHADIFVTEDDAFCWHPSLAEAGFGPPERVRQALDEEKGPKLVFADGTQSIYLADMSGDGLTDLVRIRNGEVSLLAQPRLRPVRDQGHDGQRAVVRFSRSVRPAARPLRGHRRFRGHRHPLPRARRGSPLLQPIRQRLEPGVHWPASRRWTICPRCRWPICWATAPRAWSGRPRCLAMRAGPCGTSTSWAGKSRTSWSGR